MRPKVSIHAAIAQMLSVLPVPIERSMKPAGAGLQMFRVATVAHHVAAITTKGRCKLRIKCLLWLPKRNAADSLFNRAGLEIKDLRPFGF